MWCLTLTSVFLFCFFGNVAAQEPAGCDEDACCDSAAMDTCYEAAVNETVQTVSDRFHNDLVQICRDLTLSNTTAFTRCENSTEGCSHKNPWKAPVQAAIQALCSEKNLPILAAQRPFSGCFHVKYGFDCISKTLNIYGSVTDYIRSHKTPVTCRNVVKKVHECAIGVFDGCQNSDDLGKMKMALLDIANAALNATGCDAQDVHDESGTPSPNECQAQMTRVTTCLKDIVSPNTVAGELLEKIRTRPTNYDETFCRTYENVLQCKNNLTSSVCYTTAARAALAKNINAFSNARNYLCNNNRKELLEFAESFQRDGCNPDDDAINNCSRAFVQNVSTNNAGASAEALKGHFNNQIDCIQKEFSSCQEKSPARLVSDAFFKEAMEAFFKDGAASLTASWASCVAVLAAVFFSRL